MSAPTDLATPSIERNLLGDFVHVVERAAIASTRTMGQGDAKAADQAAVHAMRQAFEGIHMAGNIVIGEGERDKAPMLYIGEEVGAKGPHGVEYPRVDIAVDPLEGTNLCATGTPMQCASWRPPSQAASCMPPIATCRKSLPAPHAGMPWISTPR